MHACLHLPAIHYLDTTPMPDPRTLLAPLLLGLLSLTAQAQNLAAGKAVTASGALYPGLPTSNLTDSIRSGTSVSHPATGATLGFFFQADLGADYPLSRVVLYNRDNCCPERLSNYRVTLYADSAGTPGAVRWQADIRTDGFNSGLGGNDTIYGNASTNPAHQFRGRFIRITNLSGAAYNPQIAELEAYPEPAPTIRQFLTDAGNIGTPGLPVSAHLSWVVESADAVSISGIGPVTTSGTATVAPASQTTYTLTATRAPSGTNATANVVIAVNAVPIVPRITEFQAADGLLEDEDGDRPDWIELYNPNTFTLNVAGYSLTDTEAPGDDWTFPLANIAPGGYAVIFASAKNRAVPGQPLHTTFSLSTPGEYLALSAPGGALVQRFPADYPVTLLFPKQYARVTYGLDGSGVAKYFKPATPGTANGSGYDGVVAETSLSVKRGIFSAPQTVAISTATVGATIRYTTNSAPPTETTGTVYAGPVTISATTTLRAAAFKTGFAPSNVDTHTYIFPADVVTQPTMSTTITQSASYGPQMIAALTDLPSLSIVTPATIVDGSNVPCSFEYIPATGAGVHEDAGIELFGGAYTNFAKKSFRLSFKAEFGATKVSLPGVFANHAHGWKPVEKFDQLEVRSGSHDMKLRGFYVANMFTDATMLDMGEFSTHGRFVHLYLNGVYWGMFHLRERWGADHHTSYFGGPKGDHESISGNLNVGGWADPGDPYDGDGASWTRIKSLRSNYAALKPYADITQYVDYMAMWMFGNAENEWRSTGPKNAGSGAKFWLNDADGWLAINAWDGNDNNTARTTPPPGRLSGDGPGSLLSALHYAGDPDFRMLVADRIHRAMFGNGALTPAANAARLNATCVEIERAFYAEAARWSTVNTSHYRTPAEWVSYRDSIFNSWLPTRTAAVISQLQTAGYYPPQAAPAFTGGTVASGSAVDFPVAGATVYFTTDGSDPRLSGGTVNPAAFTGSSIVLTQNTWLRARAKSATAWSALNEAFYTVTAPLVQGDVVFSEIHYNPKGDDNSEFIELWNRTARAVNLRGAKFTAGISYDFPDNRDVPLAPGGRLVLCASEYNFQLRYGTEIAVGGVYFDHLGNDGDTVALASSIGAQLITLHYGDTAPWPDSADGNGYSMVLANAAAPTAAASWRTSIALHGNPGTSDSIPFAGSPLADADADGLPALIEHFLATSDTNPESGISTVIPGRTADGRTTLTFPRRLSADDLVCAVEVSTDLLTWQADAARTAHVNLGNGIAMETWTASTAASPQFLRIRVTKP